MITVYEIGREHLEHLVKVAYLGDDEGIFKFHVEPLNYQDGVEKTLEMIDTMGDTFSLHHYQVDYNGMPIGYFSFFEVLLYSFGINIVYRSKKGVLQGWWNEMIKVIGKDFAIVLQDNNTRAIKFLKRFGMVQVSAPIDDNLITLVNNF